jgi:hypothetical protein
MVFGLTQLGLEPTIYRTRGEYANYYNTDEIKILLTFLILHISTIKYAMVVIFSFWQANNLDYQLDLWDS